MRNINIITLIILIVICPLEKLFPNKANQNSSYLDFKIGSWIPFGLKYPEGYDFSSSDEDWYHFGIEYGLIVKSNLLCGISFDWLFTWLEAPTDAEEEDQHRTYYSLTNLYINSIFYPFYNKDDLPIGFFLRGGLGYTRVGFESKDPVFSDKYEDTNPNRGIIALAGIGYTFKLCFAATVSIQSNLSYHRYLYPGGIDDIYIVNIFFSSRMFFEFMK